MAWFDGLTISQEQDGTTTPARALIDQAALYGVLSRLRDLGATLLLVERLAAAGLRRRSRRRAALAEVIVRECFRWCGAGEARSVGALKQSAFVGIPSRASYRNLYLEAFRLISSKE